VSDVFSQIEGNKTLHPFCTTIERFSEEVHIRKPWKNTVLPVYSLLLYLGPVIAANYEAPFAHAIDGAIMIPVSPR
jgi:hypothetical protein